VIEVPQNIYHYDVMQCNNKLIAVTLNDHCVGTFTELIGVVAAVV